MLAYVYLSLLILSIVCIIAYFKLRITQDQSANNPNFIQFQRRYIPIYLLAVLGDWLQGPYLYRLYHYYGYVENQVAVIYVLGLVSSAAVFPAKDFIANKFGRRKTVIMFSLLYALSCLFTLSSRYIVLIAGRCLAGMANSLLFSSLEAWYMHEHIDTHDFPKEWIQVTFNHIAFGNGIMAVIAGIVADLLARWLHFGPSSPFQIALPVLVLVSVLVMMTWNENKGQEEDFNFSKVRKSCGDGLKAITPDVFLVGTIQSLFESSLFVFVFIWTPAIGGRLKHNKDVVSTSAQGLQMSDIPLGIAFASFMVCFLLGGIICDYLTHKGNYRLPNLLLPISAASAILFFFSSFFSRNNPSVFLRSLVLICLQLLEFSYGFYFPVMRTLRDKVLPKEHRLSIINWFRVPLTLLSALALLSLHDASGGISEIFLFCAILMLVAFLCSIRFVKTSGSNTFQDETINI